MLVIFMHVMADGTHFKALYLMPHRLFLHDLCTGGPEDTSASLKCRVLFSVQFPFKDRKRKVHHHEVHPLAIFEAVSGRVLEQLMRTGMTSKGGIRPILTMEGKFHFTLIPIELGLTKECRSSFPCCWKLYGKNISRRQSLWYNLSLWMQWLNDTQTRW